MGHAFSFRIGMVEEKSRGREGEREKGVFLHKEPEHVILFPQNSCLTCIFPILLITLHFQFVIYKYFPMYINIDLSKENITLFRMQGHIAYN